MAQLLTLPPDKAVHILFAFLHNTMNLFMQSVNLKSYALVSRHIDHMTQTWSHCDLKQGHQRSYCVPDEMHCIQVYGIKIHYDQLLYINYVNVFFFSKLNKRYDKPLEKYSCNVEFMYS